MASWKKRQVGRISLQLALGCIPQRNKSCYKSEPLSNYKITCKYRNSFLWRSPEKTSKYQDCLSISSLSLSSIYLSLSILNTHWVLQNIKMFFLQFITSVDIEVTTLNKRLQGWELQRITMVWWACLDLWNESLVLWL